MAFLRLNCASAVVALGLFLLVPLIDLPRANGHVITPAPRLPFHDIDPADARGLFGRMPDNWLGKRQVQITSERCDGGEGYFVCWTGTCYTGTDGFIGCCSVSSCRARTTCIDYNPTSTRENCDLNTGGCIQCSNPSNPYCVKQINTYENQYIMFCGGTAKSDSMSFVNHRTTGSIDTVGPEPFVPPPPSDSVGTITLSELVTVTAPSPPNSVTSDSATNTTPHTSSNIETSESSPSSTLSTSGTIGRGSDVSSSAANSRSPAFTSTHTSNSPSASSYTDDNGPGLSTGAITGIAVAGAAGIAFVAASAWYLRRKQERKDSLGSSIDEKPKPGYTPLAPGSNGPEGGPSELESSELKQGPWSPSSLNPRLANPELDSTPVPSQQVSPEVAQSQFSQSSGGGARPVSSIADTLHPPSLTPAIQVHSPTPSEAELPADNSPRSTRSIDWPLPPTSNNDPSKNRLYHPHSTASMVNNATYNPNNPKTHNLIPYSFDDSEMSPRSAGPTYMTAEEAMGGGGKGFWENERSNSVKGKGKEAERPVVEDTIVVEPLHINKGEE